MSHDSIGRFDYSYADRFNVHTTNSLKDPKEVLHSLTVPSKDTIAPSQEKIDAEILNRLQANTDGVPQDKLPVIARAGKFIFIAVAVPTYLLAYSIPKWVAAQLIPNTYQLLEKGIKQTFKPMQELVMQFMRQFQRLIKVFRRERTKTTKSESRFKGLMAMLKYPFAKMKGLWEMMRLRIKERRSALQDLLGEIKKNAKEKLKALGDSAKRTAIRMVYGRLTKDEPLAPWREKLIALANTLYRAYKYTAALPGRAVKAVKQTLSETYMTYVFPYVDLVRTKVGNAIKKTTQRIGQRGTAFINLCKKFAEKQIERFRKVTETAFKAVRDAIVQSATAAANALGIPKLVNFTVSIWQSGLGYIQRGRERAKNAGRALSNKFASVSAKVKNRLGGALQRAGELVNAYITAPLMAGFHKLIKSPLQTLSKGREALKKTLKAMYQKIASIRKVKDKQKRPALTFKKLKERAGRRARRAVYYTRLTASWTRILTGFWMVSVRNTCQTCVDHFTWRDVVYFFKNMGVIFGSLMKYLAERSKRRYLKTADSQRVA